MKKKLLIAAILLMANGSVLAVTGHGYRIIKEELHAASGSNFHVEEVAPGTTAFMGKKSLANGITSTLVPNRTGKLMQIAQIDGYHHIAISNMTSKKEVFEYKVSLDCTTAHSYYNRYIELDPGGTYQTDDHSYSAIQGSAIGNYTILGATSVASGSFSTFSTGNGILSIIR